MVRMLADQMPRTQQAKHKQMIYITSSKDLTEFASEVEKFIDTGNKVNILISVVSEAASRKLTKEQIGSIIGDFINYRDKPLPRFAPKWVLHRIEIKNRENRAIALQDMIERLKKY